MACLWALSLLLNSIAEAGIIISLAIIGLVIFLAVRGNELAAKNYLKKGWEIYNADSNTLTVLRKRWKINAVQYNLKWVLWPLWNQVFGRVFYAL